MTQIELHSNIDSLLAGGVENANADGVRILLSKNNDAKSYFFSTVDESWFDWLWKNGFLDIYQNQDTDGTKSSKMSELQYITRVVEKIPASINRFILSTPISEANFNSEVINRFFRILGIFPAQEIKKLLPKVLKENWVELMSGFNQSGYEYRKVVEKLRSERDFDSLLVLTRIILTLRDKGESRSGKSFSDDDLFYLKDIVDTEIFEAILDDENNKVEASLKVFTDLLIQVVSFENPEEEEVFSVSEPFYLRDVDLFTINLIQENRSYSKEDLKSLIAVTKELIEKSFRNVCGNEIELKRLYTTYLQPLPDSYTLWRLKLFAISRCPEQFKVELKDAFFRVFNVGERYFEIDGGAEYHHALVLCFGVLDLAIKREYISSVFAYYGAVLDDQDIQGWRKRDGLEILDYIADHLTPEEKERAKVVFGEIPTAGRRTPHASIEMGRGGAVQHKSHVSLADFEIDEIIEHLKSDWSPEVLNEQFKDDDFLAPRGAEGLGDALKADFRVRIDQYFAHLNEFFDRESIHSSYLYSLLRDVDEMLRNKLTLTDEQNLALLKLFDLIRTSGEADGFVRVEDRSWLADWITVHKISADILLGILATSKDSAWFRANRELILSLIRYLLSIESSPAPDEDDPKFGGPFHVALNSVRGQAYTAFVQFVYNDGKVLAPDVKVLFEKVLDFDTSNPIRFLIGHYIATFFFRDKPYIKELMSRIFPKGEIGKEKIYFASWEGYLANTLYGDLFEELREYYQYAISLESDSYPDREYFKGLDETLATHLALEFAHFDFSIDDPLFVSFWDTPNENRHYEFVSFIGRSCLTRDQAGDKWLKDNNVSKGKLTEFWDWLLTTEKSIEPKAFSGFGFWVNPDKEVLDEKIITKNLALSLKKSNGEIDWDYGLMQRIKVFAEIDPTNALVIITNLLLLDDELNPNRRAYFGADSEIKKALTIIYKNDTLKPKVEELINALIEKGSSAFWDLKDVLS